MAASSSNNPAMEEWGGSIEDDFAALSFSDVKECDGAIKDHFAANSASEHEKIEELYLGYFHGGKSMTYLDLSNKQFPKSFKEIELSSVWPTPEGWFFVRKHTRECFMLNPDSLEKVELPPQLDADPKNFSTCILSGHPNESRFRILLAEYNFCMAHFYCRQLNKWQHGDLPRLLSSTFVGGKFVGRSVRNEIINAGKNDYVSTPTGQKFKVPKGTSCDYFMVEASGVVYSVATCFAMNNILSFPFKFVVEKLNVSQASWEEVNTIGSDTIFLLGINGFATSISASRFGLKGNCIYTLRIRDYGVCVYDMDDGISSYFKPPENLPLPRSTPSWILPPI